MTKSRVISSVTAELAEAPTNYVDFEDEQEKLKSMVKNKNGVKDKTVVDSLVSGAEMTLGADTCVDQASGGDIESKTLTSDPMSPASSIRSLSTPTSPTMVPVLSNLELAETPGWSIICHTVPCERARLSPITGLMGLDGHALALSLHECG